MRTGLGHVDVHAQLRGVVLAVGAHVDQQLALAGHAQQLVAGVGQRFVAGTRRVLQEEGEARADAQLRHRRRCEGEDEGVLDLHQRAHRATRHRIGAVASTALVPLLEFDEGHARVLRRAGEAEALHGEHRFHRVLLVVQEVVFQLVDGLQRALLGGAHRRIDHCHQDALVFIGQERAGQAHEQQQHAHGQRKEHRHEAHRALQDALHATLVALAGTVEAVVEPVEEAPGQTAMRGVVFTLFQRLEHGGAQRGSQHDGHQHRQRHRRNDGG